LNNIRLLDTLFPNIVQICIDPSIESKTTLQCQESYTEDGDAVVVQFFALLPIQSGVDIAVASKENLIAVKKLNDTKAILGHRKGEWSHIDDTNRKDGVVKVNEPLEILKEEIMGGIAVGVPGKIVGSFIGAVVLQWFHYPVIDSVLWFSIFALIDWIIAMFPKVHNKEHKRTSVMWSRVQQWAISMLFFGGLLAMKQYMLLEKPTGVVSDVVRFMLNYYAVAVILFYLTRMFGAVLKAFYGNKASVVGKKVARLVPKKYQHLIYDKDLMD
jgi:hypothetical protein